MRVFISGSKSISKLPEEVKSLLDTFIATDAEILVGDCYGVDAAVQMYLDSKGYSNVIVYCSGETPRNNFVTGLQSGNYDLGRKKQRHQRKHSPRKGNGETVQNYKRELTNNFVHDIIYRKKNIILQYIKNEVQLCQTHQTLK